MSVIMSSIERRWPAFAAAATIGVGVFLNPAIALAEPTPGTETSTEAPPPPVEEVLHNITYRARIDGVSRGANISYSAEGDQTQTANPTMVPGRIFEAQTVLPTSKIATMRVSIQWPYSANLHCEILVDDAVVAQADDLIAPRVLPQKDDPDYGAITCEAPVSGISNTSPVDPPAPLLPPIPPPPA